MATKSEFILQGTDKTKRAFKSAQANLKSLTGAVFSAKSAILGLVGVGGLGALSKSAIDSADKIQAFSDRLGISSRALSEYRLVAAQAGIDFNGLTVGFQRMTRRIAEAATGTGEAVKTLDALGLSATRLNSLRPDQQFEEIAEALSKIDNQSDRVRLAFKLFDTEGVALVQAMEKGAAGIREVREEARAMGLSLTELETKQLSSVNSAFETLNLTIGAQFQKSIADSSESIVGLADSFSRVLPQALDETNKAFGVIFRNIAGVMSKIDNATLHFNQVKFDQNEVAIEGIQKTLRRLEEQGKTALPRYKRMTERLMELTEANSHYRRDLDKTTTSQHKWEKILVGAPKNTAKYVLGVEQATKSTQNLRKEVEKFQELGPFKVDVKFNTDLSELEGFDQKFRTDRINEQFSAFSSLVEQSITPAERLQQELQTINEVVAQMPEAAELSTRATAQAYKNFEDANKKTADKTIEVWEAVGRRTEDAIVDSMFNAGSAFDGFKSVALSVIEDITRAWIRSAFIKPAVAAITGFDFSSFFSGISIPGFAKGGITPGGPIAVGEDGPEILVPPRGSQVIPNDQISRGGRSANQPGGDNIKIDINLALGVSQTVQAEIMQMLPLIEKKIMTGIVDARRRGGPFSTALNG